MKQDFGRRKPALNPSHGSSTSAELFAEVPTRVFISYRREDTAAAAAHLRRSLGQRLGEGKIFRDEDTIPLGQNFETFIEEAIRGTTVCLVLIGPDWLTVTNPSGLRRLDDPEDYVRKEIESALRANIEVIPVLVDGAKMPARKQLPNSIKDLAVRNAYELPWQTGILKLGNRIDQLERQRQSREAAERAERERLDLTGGEPISVSNWRSQSAVASFNVVVRAMEISLARQGQKVWLSVADLADSYKKLSGRTLEVSFRQPEITHIIDFVGIKAKTSSQRYVARSLPVKTFADVPRQLMLGRPILGGLMVQRSWFEGSIMKTGVIDLDSHSELLGSVLGALLGWDPGSQNTKILTPWSTWGIHGMGIMTKAAAETYLRWSDMRSIEAVVMPGSPFSFAANRETSERRGARKRNSPSMS